MMSWGSFSKLMKGNFWNRTNSVKEPDMQLSKYSGKLSSYAAACQGDSDLKSFDSSLQERTYTVIGSLATRPQPQYLSLDSLMDVYGFLFGLNQDALRFIVDSREDVRKNKDLKALVELYFNSSKKTLELCNTVKTCVKKIEISQSLLGLAVTQFEEESTSLDTDQGGSQKKYAKTLEELKNIKATGDPFDAEFVTQYESMYEQQVLLLKELHKLDKKLRKGKTWRKLLYVLFVTAYVSVLVLSVLAAAMGWPDVVGAVASLVAGPIEKGGQWWGKVGKKYEEAVRRQSDLIFAMKMGTAITKLSMETMRIQVEILSTNYWSMLMKVEFAVEREEEEAIRIVMQDLKETVDDFAEKIERVGQSAATYSGTIVSGNISVFDRIDELPTATSVSS